jgi:hypothetical protein
VNTKVKIAITAIICLAIGYFGGREYLKYQIRSTMQHALTEVRSGLAGTLGDNAPTERPKSAPPPQVPAEQPLTTTLLKKAFKPSDPQSGDFESDITFTLQFSNKTDKNIRAFDGVVSFTDLLGNQILGSKVEINERIPAGQTLDWAGALKYNQFIDSHQRLRSEPMENLKVSFVTHKILFEDGATKEY